jgi:HD-like signal output (HDOD) protein
MLNRPLPDLDAWTSHFKDADIPVLPTTVEEIRLMREAEERSGAMDANTIAQGIAGDPLMTLRVLRYAALAKRPGSTASAETVTEAIVLVGIGPFFREFEQLTSLADHLRGQMNALLGLQRLVRRAHRAAKFALGFANHRMDADAAVIQEAALIHDFAEMLLWCHAPALAEEIARIQVAQPHRRSAEVQFEVLGIDLGDLQRALMAEWHLPDLLLSMSDHRHLLNHRNRIVELAMRVARHTHHGWDDPHNQVALDADFAELGQVLTLSSAAARRLALDLDK